MPFSKEMTILIVDDHQNMRRTIASILRNVGFKNCVFAENGQEAIAILQQQPVDMLILDWSMPVMDGYETLTWIRGEEEYKNLPILMVTAEADVQKVTAAIKAGVTNYVVKPFTPLTLYKKFKEMFGVAL
jgi:two-component system chemotaxis response regulator CheY